MSDYEKMLRLIEQIDHLRSEPQKTSSPQFRVWKHNCLRLLSHRFQEGSTEYESFRKIHFTPLTLYGSSTDYGNAMSAYITGLDTAKGYLQSYLEDLDQNGDVSVDYDLKKVFIVHGHDKALKYQVALLMKQQEIDAIILDVETSEGKTIIEKIEHYRDVGAAIILFTPDDTGKANKESDYKARARQNVVFEAGYFMGYLGRNRIIPIVTDESIELPSDLQGMVYTSHDMWQFKVIQELKAIGFDVDMNMVKF